MQTKLNKILASSLKLSWAEATEPVIDNFIKNKLFIKKIRVTPFFLHMRHKKQRANSILPWYAKEHTKHMLRSA